MYQDVVILAAVRTAIGEFGKSLCRVPAVDLGAVVIKEALQRPGVDPGQVDEVYMGNVIQAGLGQCTARQAAIRAGLPVETPALTFNRVCASGLTAVNLAATMITAGRAEVMVAGGMENMSQGPYAVQRARWGCRLGDQQFVDLTVHDGLWDAFNDYHIAITAENLAAKYGISREAQDRFALASHRKAVQAIEQRRFVDEIVGIKTKDGLFAVDERPRPDTSLDKLAQLPTVFKEDGTVTAGNASGINDGAAALLLSSEKKARELGITPLARIRSFAASGVDPQFMGIAPVTAVNKALAQANLSLSDIDLIETNEAFAAQSLAVIKELSLDEKRLNPNGGAIALGHPIGASGARILVTLLYAMKAAEAGLGLATLCVGGGQGVATIVERCRD